MDLGLRDKVALVTAGSKGLGKAIALRLAQEGARIAICARNETPLREAAAEIEAATGTYQREVGYSAYRPVVIRHTHVHVRPYSYWVGYPWWYHASYSYYAPWYYWYPRTHWAFGGFYFGPRLFVSFGVPLPSAMTTAAIRMSRIVRSRRLPMSGMKAGSESSDALLCLSVSSSG